MKIDLGHGSYLEPDEGPRNTRFHKRIVRVEPIPNTRTGNNVTLECGHGVQTFGNLAHAGGVCLCTKCRDLEEPSYLLLEDGKAIQCLTCRMTSHNPNDVESRYCGNCHKFHEDSNGTRTTAD